MEVVLNKTLTEEEKGTLWQLARHDGTEEYYHLRLQEVYLEKGIKGSINSENISKLEPLNIIIIVIGNTDSVYLDL